MLVAVKSSREMAPSQEMPGAKVPRVRSLAGDAGGEGAEGTEDDLVALQDELTHAYAELGEDADDGTLGEDAVVVGDVVGELLGAHEARELQVAVGLAGLLGVHGILHHGDTVLDFLHFVEAPS